MTQPLNVFSFAFVLLTQSSETGIALAASTSLLTAQASDVMIDTVRPGNMNTWRNVGPSSQH